MVLPKPFQHQPEAIISFDFVDIAEGTGIVLFSGFSGEISSGLGYHLTADEAVYSSTKETSGSDATAPAVDLDFDLSPFNRNRTIRGKALVSFTLVCAPGVNNMTGLATVFIRKWDGSTETEIASVITPTITANATTVKELMTVPIIIPKTDFKRGETLRLSIVAVGTRTGGATDVSIIYGHDPRNRDGGTIIPSTDDPDTITKLNFYAPFEIDI